MDVRRRQAWIRSGFCVHMQQRPTKRRSSETSQIDELHQVRVMRDPAAEPIEQCIFHYSARYVAGGTVRWIKERPNLIVEIEDERPENDTDTTAQSKDEL